MSDKIKIQIEHYDRKIIIEDNADLNIHDMFKNFKFIALAVGFVSKSIDDAIIEMYEEVKTEKS